MVRITSLLTTSTVAVAAPRAQCRQLAPSLDTLLTRISCHVSQIRFYTNRKWNLMSKMFGIFQGASDQDTNSITTALATLSNSACTSHPDDPSHCQFIPQQALLQQGRFNALCLTKIQSTQSTMDRSQWTDATGSLFPNSARRGSFDSSISPATPNPQTKYQVY